METGGRGAPPVAGNLKNFVPLSDATRMSPSSSQANDGDQNVFQSAIGLAGTLPSTRTLISRRSWDCSESLTSAAIHWPSGEMDHHSTPSVPASALNS